MVTKNKSSKQIRLFLVLTNRIEIKVLLTNGSLNFIKESDSINKHMNYFEKDLNISIKKSYL